MNAVRNRRIGSFSKDDGNENSNAIGLISKTTTLLVPHFFCSFQFAVTARLRRENSRFTEDVSER